MRTITSSLGASTRNRLRTLQKVLAICTAGLFTVGAGRASAQGEADVELTLAQIRTAVNEVATTVSREYMDATVAERAATVLRRRLADGHYLHLTTPGVLADRLTYDLFLESKDKHLRVAVVPRSHVAAAAATDARERDVVRSNAGVQRIEILAGNIGYLNLTSFWRDEEAHDTITHAMGLLQRAEALIIDLRDNGGGSPGTVARIAGYLFDQPALPLFQIVPRSGEPASYATPAVAVPERNERRPVYVLTSSRTFSAGEGLAFLLQERERAEIIGERTAGAANPGGPHRIASTLEVTIPNGRVRSAVKGDNWEGQGVTPDVMVAAADALTVAHAHALKQLIAVTEGDWRVRLQEFLQTLGPMPSSPPLRAETTGSDSQLAARVDLLMARAVSSGFGGAIILERDGRQVLASGYGLANRRLNTRFTTDTIAPINSITKSFTALAMMQLSARGQVNLQAPLKAYLKSANEPAALSRLHDVLVHHAGLPPHCAEDYERRTKEELIADCTRQSLAAARGALSYSNPGYSYLAAIVEEVSGITWEEYLRAHIFQPAGMNRSGWPFAAHDVPEIAEGYVNGVPRVVPTDRLTALGSALWNWKGNGELHASANDMQRFFRFLINQPRRILEPMTLPQTEEYAPGVRDAYGFALRFDRSGVIYRIGSSGSDGAFVSYLMWLPQQRVFMYFVGNNGEDRVRPVLSAVVDAIQKAVGAGQ